ncbi:MAG TPA: hypothetical protein VGH74_22480 [Planctomycetaceae bacterium]|jgi:hypothetical protein
MLKRHYLAGAVCGWIAAIAMAGCESPEWTRSLNDSFFAATDHPSAKTEESHRQEYVATHSHESMRWLLSNCVEMGMSYKKVCHIMGEEGTPVAGDNRVLSGGGNYRLGDEVYAFGPDTKGKTVYLAFREDRLVNYDRSEFK